MSQQSRTVQSLVRLALYQWQISEAARNLFKQYFQVGLSVQVAGTDISFDAATKTIGSTSSDLSRYANGQQIEISGSTSNDGVLTVSGVPSANALVVAEALTDEAAGASVAIELSDYQRAQYVAAASLDFGVTDAERAAVLTNLASLSESLAKLSNGGVPATSIDTSADWLATMLEVKPAGLGVAQLEI